MKKSFFGHAILVLLMSGLLVSCGSDNSTGAIGGSSASPGSNGEYNGSNYCLQNLSDYVSEVYLADIVEGVKVEVDRGRYECSGGSFYYCKNEKISSGEVKEAAKGSNKARLFSLINSADACEQYGNMTKILVDRTIYQFNTSRQFPVEANPIMAISYNQNNDVEYEYAAVRKVSLVYEGGKTYSEWYSGQLDNYFDELEAYWESIGF